MSQRKKVTFEGDSRGTITPAPMQQPPRSPDSSDSKEPTKESTPATSSYFSYPFPGNAYPYAWPQMNPMYGMYNPYPYAPVPVVPVSTVQVATQVEPKEAPKDIKETAPIARAETNTPQKRAIALNLDDPEELERWKAERRKRFPGRAKEAEEQKKPESEENKEETKFAPDDLEEGETAEEPEKQIKKRPCKYFAAGKCRNGDACSFSHVQKPKGLPAVPVQAGQTVFENLQAKQEREDLLKFYECLKRLARNNK